jgi:hypothetical protein
MKYKALLLFLWLPLAIFAQQKTPTLEEATSFLADTTSYVVTFVISDSGDEYEKYTGKKVGEIIIEGSYIYKILEFKEVMSANYGFILLDTANLSTNEINTLRETIISKFKFGIPFPQLSEQYSKEKSADTGMDLRTNDFGQQFQAIADSHYAGDIFTIDPPVLNTFAVVVKNTETALRKFVIVEHAVYE